MSILLMGLHGESLADADRARIQAAAPDMELLVSSDRAEIERALDHIEIAVGDLPHDLLPRAHALRWLQQWGAGVDWLMRQPEAAAMDFTLTNASGVHAVPISEHILAFLFALARRFPAALHAQRAHRWARVGDHHGSVFELAGKTLLLIGVGAIGERTAVIASGVGMTVIGVRRNPDTPAQGVGEMHAMPDLPVLLPRADFVVLTVPLTHETRGMIGEAELRAMKPTSYIVNIGRGGTIQEQALIHALREGWIAGAGLDVFEQEPLPKDSPLWDMENVIITAHYSGSTPHYHERAMAIFLDNLERYKTGRPLRNVVDKRLGY
ncbi:MAG: D-2-hydroxyacid dehydrogenase [Anaerolineae bacterium]